MFSPRNLIIAGVALVAIALGPAGHGLWWLVGFLWLLPRVVRHGGGCCPGGAGRADDAPQEGGISAPDPTRDQHDAFPSRP